MSIDLNSKLSRKKYSATRYKKAIVSFIDILGFKALIKQKPSAKTILKIQKDFQEYTAEDKSQDVSTVSNPNPMPVSWSLMSDCIVRVRDIDTKKEYGAFYHEINKLAFGQGLMLSTNVLLRGAITVGDIYHEGQNLFGPALIDAYTLETEFANYPRIIIDPKAILLLKSDSRMRSSFNDPEWELNFMKGILKKDNDGLYFIDYIEILIQSLDGNYLEYHREQIIELIKQVKGTDLKVITKYLWLVNYHNEKCNNHSFPELTITSDDWDQITEIV